jgi:hypothetical protein
MWRVTAALVFSLVLRLTWCSKLKLELQRVSAALRLLLERRQNVTFDINVGEFASRGFLLRSVVKLRSNVPRCGSCGAGVQALACFRPAI